MPARKITKKSSEKKPVKEIKREKVIKVKTVKSVIPASNSSVQSDPVVVSNPRSSFTNILRKPLVIIIFIVIILVVGGYFFWKWVVIAEVDGQPISRLDYIHQLEMQDNSLGSQVMNEVIAKTLVLQQADKQHVTVSQSDIDDKIKNFQASQGQTLDQYLTLKKIKKQDFIDDIKLQVVLEKLLAKDIIVTDKEVTDYIDQNKSSIPPTIKPFDLKNQVKQQLQEEKLREKLPAFIQELQKKAKIIRFIN